MNHDDPQLLPMVAQVPLPMRVPAAMREAVEEVLAGEYEAGYFGEKLRILDLGANVGAFTRWAHLRWPGSTIHAFEPHPGTFAFLRDNVAGLSDVVLHNAAVYPTNQHKLPFFTRYDGDGESGLADCMAKTFVEAVPGSRTFFVDVVHPASLPAADVIKLDVEGAEAEILAQLPLGEVSLVLLEYQTNETRAAIKRQLAGEFVLEFEDAMPWDDLLGYAGYRAELAGNQYGRLFFSRRGQRRLRKLASPRFTMDRPAVFMAGVAESEARPRGWLERFALRLRSRTRCRAKDPRRVSP